MQHDMWAKPDVLLQRLNLLTAQITKAMDVDWDLQVMAREQELVTPGLEAVQAFLLLLAASIEVLVVALFHRH